MTASDWAAPSGVLVVGLNDIIPRADSTLEAFWVAASARWTGPLKAIVEHRGSLELRERLEVAALRDPARLRFRDDALRSIEEWRRRGGRVALLSDAPRETAEIVARHLELFDEVHAIANTGEEHCQLLDEVYGPGQYARLEEIADVFRAQGSIEVEAENPSVDPIRHLPAPLRLLRPHQWLKNLLIFVPMMAAHELTIAAFWHAMIAFVAFSLTASGTYVLNDLLDLDSDRAHPRKCKRPLASGAVSVTQGTLMLPILTLGGAAIALMSGPQLLGMLLLYVILTTAYSIKLKRLVMIDICILAILYTMRILAGSVATGIPSSVWLLAFSIFFFFSLAAVKRQAELVDGIASGTVTAHGRGYHVDDLSVVGNIVVASGMISVMVLALYANSEPVMRLYSRPEMLWGVCLVLLFWNSRIAILTHRGEMHDDPLVFAACDRVSQLCGVLVLMLAIAGAVL